MLPKRCHTVSEFYLNYFLVKGEKTFWVYDKQNKGQARRQQPKDTTVIGHYYTFTTLGGKRESLEPEFSRLEGAAKPILDRWQEPKATIQSQESELIAAFLSLLISRGSRAVRIGKALEIGVLIEILRETAKDPEEVRKSWKKLVEEKGHADIFSLEQFQAFLEEPSRDFEIVETNEKFPLSQSLLLAENILPWLLDRNWCLCLAPNGSFFVTSDTPISVFEPGQNRAWGYGGFGLGNAEVAFPISSRICLLLSYRHTQKRWSVSKRFVDRMNVTTISLAERFIISPLESNRLRKLVLDSPVPPTMADIDYEKIEQLVRSSWDR